MQAYLDQINSLTEWNWQGGLWQWLFYATILFVIIFEKNRTIKIVLGWVPLVYLICLYSPLLWNAMKLAGAWDKQYFARMFSFMPLMYTIAHGILCLLSKGEGKLEGWKKFVLVCAVCVVLGLTGRNIFNQDWYVRATNWEKVSQDTLEVKAILDEAKTEDGNIRVAAIDPVTNYMRQTADYLTPYARGLGELGQKLSEDPPDVATVMEMAGEQDVEFILTHRTEETLKAFSEQGYEPYAFTTRLAIYKVEGVKKRANVYNEKRQTIATTTYDEAGNPVPGPEGYATIAYEYDENGYSKIVKYLDQNGEPYEVYGENAFFSGVFSSRGLLKAYTYLDAKENPILKLGRFKTSCEYSINGNLIREFFYDAQGKPMLKTDGFYASHEIAYNGHKAVVGEKYYDIDGNLCLNSFGYAEYRRELDEKSRILQESYYDTRGNPQFITAGYAAFLREYDDMDNILRETYLDGNGNPVIRNTGYAEVRWEYNDRNQIIRETYWDEQGNPVADVNGNYGFIREYDEAGNMTAEIYFDAERESVY